MRKSGLLFSKMLVAGSLVVGYVSLNKFLDARNELLNIQGYVDAKKVCKTMQELEHTCSYLQKGKTYEVKCSLESAFKELDAVNEKERSIEDIIQKIYHDLLTQTVSSQCFNQQQKQVIYVQSLLYALQGEYMDHVPVHTQENYNHYAEITCIALGVFLGSIVGISISTYFQSRTVKE